ncbi:hypothetical protein DFH09DRAFT_1302834 [Mycena vulgaris]|nr:hypothetical protein DFH09DRAFT_1302834 [Mycena vulgaris]
MHLTIFINNLGIILLLLNIISHIHASPLHHIPPDHLRCPKGYSISFLYDSYTYHGRLDKFTAITKSFFHIQWYGNATVDRTTGTDNVPGATRSGQFGISRYKETLTAYSAHSDALVYSIHGDLPLSIQVPNQHDLLHVATYAERKRFESICGGRATFLEFITYLCSDDPRTADRTFRNVHTATVQGLASRIGTTILSRDCRGSND